MFIPLGFLYAIIPILGTGMIVFTSWLFRVTGKHAELLAAIATSLKGHDERLSRLEGWQDGVRFGRDVETAKRIREESP